MTRRKANGGLDFEALQLGIEWCDLERVLGFYAEDAELSIVNAGVRESRPFELRGRAEIAKYLRAAFDQGASHRVERRVIGKERVTYREACEYPDGGRVVVETTLEVRGGKILRQVDAVVRNSPADGEGELAPGVAAISNDVLSRSEQPNEKEDSE